MRLIKKDGFTLIELLVVIAIIGILSTIVITALGDARAKGRDAKRISDVKNIELSLKLYYADNGARYPSALSILVPNYLSVLPKDPMSPSQEYKYVAFGSGTTCNTFHLGTVLETSSTVLNDDVDYSATSGGCTGGFTQGYMNGLSAGGGSPIMCDTTAGTAAPGGTERCYDVRP